MDNTTWATELSHKYVSHLEPFAQWHAEHGIAWSLGAVLIFTYAITALNAFFFGIKAPKVGPRSFWEPRWLVGMRFAQNSAPMVLEGYRKVSKLARNILL